MAAVVAASLPKRPYSPSRADLACDTAPYAAVWLLQAPSRGSASAIPSPFPKYFRAANLPNFEARAKAWRRGKTIGTRVKGVRVCQGNENFTCDEDSEFAGNTR
eukprot:1253867-Rhodomonas_salina.2